MKVSSTLVQLNIDCYDYIFRDTTHFSCTQSGARYKFVRHEIEDNFFFSVNSSDYFRDIYQLKIKRKTNNF